MGEPIAKPSPAAGSAPQGAAPPAFIDLATAGGRSELLSHLGRVNLVVSADLESGSYELPSSGATLSVSRDTTLSLTLGLARDVEGMLALGVSTATLTRPVKLQNCLGGFVPVLGTIADWFFDLRFQGFRYQPRRPLELEAGLRCGFVELLAPDFVARAIKSAVEARVQKLLGGSSRALALPGAGEPAAPEVPAADWVKLLARMVKRADWSVEVDLRSLAAGGRLPMADVQWAVSERQLVISGTVRSESGNGLRVDIEHGTGERLEACGHVVVGTHGPAITLEGDARLRLPLAGGALTLRPLPDFVLPLQLRGARGAVHLSSSWALRDGKLGVGKADVHLALDAHLDDAHEIAIGPATLRTKGGQLSVTSSAKLTFADGVLRAENAKLNAIVAARQVDLLYRRFNARVDGLAAVEVDLRDLELDSRDGISRAGGSTTTTLGEPAKPEADASFPHVMPSADLELVGSERLRITPGQPSAGDLLSDLFELSPNVSKVVDPLKAHGFASASAELKALVTTRTEAALRKGNRVKPLIDGVASRPARLELIAQAQRTICLQTLIFKEDKTGREVIDALIAARARGVDVRVIIDAAGNIESFGDATHGKPFYTELRDKGVEVRLYNDPLKSWLSELVPLLGVIPEIDELPLTDLPKILKDPAMLLRLLNRLLRMSNGRNRDATERQEDIKRVIQRIDQATTQRANAAASARTLGELATLISDNVLSASELIALLKRSQVLNHRWHEKYLIADGRAVVMGGMNIADEYLLGGTGAMVGTLGKKRPAWRDMDVLIEGPAAFDAFTSFADNWEELARVERVETGSDAVEPRIMAELPEPIDGGVEVQIIQHRPLEDGDHSIGNFMIEQLKALGHGDRAWIANAYFLPTGALTAFKVALMEAAKRGVDVRVVTNAAETSDLPNINKVAAFACRELLGAKVRIFERDAAATGGRTMHTKAAVFGKLTAAIGSWNADNRSESLNSEALAVIYDSQLADTYAAAILADMQPGSALELTLPEFGSRSLRDEVDAYLQSVLTNLM